MNNTCHIYVKKVIAQCNDKQLAEWTMLLLTKLILDDIDILELETIPSQKY